MNSYIVDLLFNYYKDDVVSSCKKFKCEIMYKYDLSAREAHDVYTKVINYQIKRYGGQIGFMPYEDYDDYKHKVENAKYRKRARRRG